MIATSCESDKKDSPVFNEVISADNLEALNKKIEEDQNIDRIEIELYSNGLTRFSLMPKKDTLFGKTVGEIINDQKNFLRLASMQGLNATTPRISLNLSHNLKLLQFQPMNDTVNNRSVNVLAFEVTNTSDKNIKNVQGYMNFYSLQNQLLIRFPLNIKKELAKGVTEKLQSPPYVHDPDNANHKFIRENPSLVRTMWQPLLVEFEDGSKIGNVPAQQ